MVLASPTHNSHNLVCHTKLQYHHHHHHHHPFIVRTCPQRTLQMWRSADVAFIVGVVVAARFVVNLTLKPPII